MDFSNRYQYPLNTESPYSAGMPVKVTRGPLRGQVGSILSATESGTYFITKNPESGSDRMDLIPHGPFYPDELEPIS